MSVVEKLPNCSLENTFGLTLVGNICDIDTWDVNIA